MKNTQINGSGGIGFLGLLTIVFIVLKLTHYIDWSWWFVLAPLWIPVIISFIMILIMLGVLAIIGNKTGLTFKKRK